MSNLVFKPSEPISELSTFANVATGDVLLTGTPNGCALRVPRPPLRRFCPSGRFGTYLFKPSSAGLTISSPEIRSARESGAVIMLSISANRSLKSSLQYRPGHAKERAAQIEL
jgi:hypothetical protein